MDTSGVGPPKRSNKVVPIGRLGGGVDLERGYSRRRGGRPRPPGPRWPPAAATGATRNPRWVGLWARRREGEEGMGTEWLTTSNLKNLTKLPTLSFTVQLSKL